MQNPSLLIVEDDETQQFIYRELCRKFDYDATICSTGEEALSRLTVYRYAAILIDYRLPGIDGAELTRRIKIVDQKYEAKTPLIAITASCMPKDEETLKAAGVDEFFRKPFSRDEFRRLLLRHVYEPNKPNMKLLVLPTDEL